MARFIHFSDIYLDKYDNERFANYITTLLAKIEDVGAKELGVEAYFEEFSTLVNLYMDLFVVPRRFLQTPELKKIEAEGQEFDPRYHQAISHEEDPNVESGKIIEVLQNGYMLGDRVIRPALVRVAK